jgi:hypothetical protein
VVPKVRTCWTRSPLMPGTRTQVVTVFLCTSRPLRWEASVPPPRPQGDCPRAAYPCSRSCHVHPFLLLPLVCVNQKRFLHTAIPHQGNKRARTYANVFTSFGPSVHAPSRKTLCDPGATHVLAVPSRCRFDLGTRARCPHTPRSPGLSRYVTLSAPHQIVGRPPRNGWRPSSGRLRP